MYKYEKQKMVNFQTLTIVNSDKPYRDHATVEFLFRIDRFSGGGGGLMYTQLYHNINVSYFPF